MDNITINMMLLEMFSKLRYFTSIEELEKYVNEYTLRLQENMDDTISAFLSEYKEIATELITQRQLLTSKDAATPV